MVKNHVFSFAIVVLLVLSVATSYFKFVYSHDYFATYETECDPESSSCFVWCEETDIECSDPYYYAYIERYAADLRDECGESVVDYDFAHNCSIQPEKSCVVEYCENDEFYECEEIN